ncbi:MAG TPA: NAD-dependent succinate-semialdehyde dehydrogenase [Candidatus Nanoarchaeia archaeon]|nr:NAD-dependent succinate-semialdehyde dehydrogenase [Candidatus Nanoarchaeia archaeon]
MKFKTINPATEEVIGEYKTQSNEEVLRILKSCHEAFLLWKKMTLLHRADKMKKLAQVLRKNTEKLARLATIEMGKPIKSARAEVEKCAWTADFYAEKAAEWLKEEIVQVDGKKHAVAFEPVGVVLLVMPWNFPFWQVFRCAIPTIIAGNAVVLRHSNQVPQCAQAIEEMFVEAGFDVFRMVITDHDTVGHMIASESIAGVSLTGSTEAGSKVAEIAGRHLKKVVLELGGSDPFIVLEDADVDAAVKNAVIGRTMNNGQSCIAAKRFIVHEKIAESFSKKFAEQMGRLVVGDPLDEKTDVGPLVNAAALSKVEQQVQNTVKKGGKVLVGGRRLERKGFFFLPTVIKHAPRDAAVVDEEVFAPCAPVIVFRNDDEAIAIANDTVFGLGGSVWTKDVVKGERIARQIDAGTVFVNSIVKSDPRMPFGGIKKSGIGRELSHYGLKEFVNVKGINVYEGNK